MIRYRITKYPPQNRNEQGWYTKEEWTSYVDIGKVYDSGLFTLEEYLKVESNYCEVAKKIMEENHISILIVEELENRSSILRLNRSLNPKKLTLSKNDIQFLNHVKNGSTISKETFKQVLTLLLRECFWCKLVSQDRKFIVETGYDYYMYITCRHLSSQIIEQAEQIGMYIEQMQS